MVFDLASLDGCTMGEEAALTGGAIWSGTGLSGLDRDDRVSNLLDTSREASVSNNDVEKLRMLINIKIVFDCYYCINSTKHCENEEILVHYIL